jgi:hypothetical protein
MDDVIVIRNVIEEDGWRVLQVMSNSPINAAFPADAVLDKTVDNGVHHLSVREPVRGAVDIYFEGLPIQYRQMVVWNFSGCKSVRDAIGQAATEFERQFGTKAIYGFMKKLPRGVDNGQEVESLELFEAEWMLNMCVAVGCSE